MTPKLSTSGTLTERDFTGTTAIAQTPHEQNLAIIRNIHTVRAKLPLPSNLYWWGDLDVSAERTESEVIFDAIQALYLSNNKPRDRQIAERITALHRDAISEGDHILAKSLSQFKDFFLLHSDIGFPKITLTPDGTLRARWIQGAGNFTAIEFTGEPLAKLVAEIPRPNNLTAPYFFSEPIQSILMIAQIIGASFG